MLLGHPLAAQEAGLDLSYGAWWDGDEPAVSYALTYHHRFLGPLDYGLGAFSLDDGRSADDRSQTGAAVSLAVNRTGLGPYMVGHWGVGFRHSDGNPDAYWSLGAGYSIRLLRFLALGVEAAYRVEDRGMRGFWRLDPADRRGFQVQGRLAVGFGSRAARGPRPSRRPPPPASRPGGGPGSALPDTGAAGPDAPSDASAEGLRVVATALDAMGAPYRWGGSDENGYDCSGLIHYSYGEHGILLPRRSRDQTRTGTRVDRDVDALRPGDILGFSINGGGVSHVGLYVGYGDFIHSTSSGVRLSSLTASDPDSRWWQQRWITARRILD